jgi:hypothetical protein
MTRAKFMLVAICLVPLTVVSAVLAAGWAYEYLRSGCLLDLSYTCGQDKSIPFVMFAVISYGCFMSLMKSKEKYKAEK